MRVIKNYNFNIGTKIPFTVFPQIIKTFMEKQNLRYKKFLYSFEDDFITNSCSRAMKACPKFGPIIDAPKGCGSYQYLTNIGCDSPVTEEDILALMPKIHRSFGFSESKFIYSDVDFFSRLIPSETEYETKSFPVFPKGSNIIFSRDSVFKDSMITLQIDILDGEKLLDASSYRDAIAELLPKIKHKERTEVFLSSEENSKIENNLEKAKPFALEIEAHLTEKICGKYKNVKDSSCFNFAPVLKKFCKEYDWEYVCYDSFEFFVRKKLQGGNYLHLLIDIAPSRFRVSPKLSLCGIGFDIPLFGEEFLPKTEEDIKGYYRNFFEAVAEEEKSAFPELEKFFERSPDWFVPDMYHFVNCVFKEDC